jgi:membrane protein
VLWSAVTRFREHAMTDRAATLTYYATMSLFPTLLLTVTLLGIFGQQGLVSDAGEYLTDHGADANTATLVRDVLANVIGSSGGALGFAFAFSALLALYGASGAFGAAGRALNMVFEVDEDRAFVRHKGVDLMVTVIVVLLALVVLVALFLGGQIAADLFGRIGLGSFAADVWAIVRWPVALAATITGYALVYALAPNLRPVRLRVFSPGAMLGVVLWIALSIAFAFYIRHVKNFGAAYGAFGGAIALLLWLFLSANAFLFGAELDAELDRRRRDDG